MKLMYHQVTVLEQSKDLNRVAYYMDMGLGKTFVGAEKAMSMGTDILIICQKSKIQDWIKHFFTYYIDKMKCDESGAWCYDLTKNIDMFTHSKYKVRIGVINYELAWRRPELSELHDFTLMLDESSMIQNHTAKQSKFILKLKPKNVILLSGSPVGGKYENLWSQCHLLGYEITKKEFEHQYVQKEPLISWDGKQSISPKGYPIMVVTGYKNEERLKRKMREYGAQFLKTEEVMDLPTQTFTNVKVKNTIEYKKFIKDKIVTINDKKLVGDMPLKKLLYARQLASQYNPNKLQAVKDLLQSSNDRFVIFYNFNSELDALRSLCTSLNKPISEVNGSKRDLAAYEFEADSVTLCQYQAAAKGLNLQLANKLIYLSPTLKVEDYMQSQKRIHRIGQERPCFYYRLITEKSVEEKIYKALEKGVDYTDALFEEDTPQ